MKEWQYAQIRRYWNSNCSVSLTVNGRYFSIDEWIFAEKYSNIVKNVQAIYEDFDLSKYLKPKMKNNQIIRYDVDKGDFHWIENEIMQRLGKDGYELCGAAIGLGEEALFFKREITSGVISPEEAFKSM